MMARGGGLPLLAVATLLALAPAVGAQEQAKPGAAPAEAAPVEDAAALIARMEKRLQELDQSTRQRDEALKYLQEQVTAARGAIDGGASAATALREGAAALSTRLDEVAAERAELSSSISNGEQTIGQLQDRLAALEKQLGEAESQRAALDDSMAARQATIGELQRQIARLGQELGAETDRGKQLDGTIAERDRAVSDLGQQVEAGKADVARLTGEVASLRGELESTRSLLAGRESTAQAQETQIASLSAKLKEALESRIEELTGYRSEFFGRLRQVLGDQPGIVVVGDRFVFQSEILFDSGSAQLGPEGQEQLRQLATTLEEVAATIPADIPWILRVDGHTDRLPIRDAPFRNNWELSAERALAVVEFLVRQGIPPERLAATGFGEYQPLDPADDEIAFRRNRRIEFKLTER